MTTDGLSWSRRLTSRLTVPLQRRIVTRGRRESLATDTWGPDALKAYHDRRLRELVRHAVRHIPFYARLYASAGIDAESFRGADDLAKLPTITKADLQASGQLMTRPGVPSWMTYTVRTSGSTGAVAAVRTYRGLIHHELGCIEALWSRVGARHRDGMAVLRGVRPAEGRQNWEYDRRTRRLILSAYQLTPSVVRAYLALMRQYEVQWLHAYPSAAWLMATIMESNGIRCDVPLRGLLLASETVLDWQLPFLREAFGCRTYAHYGHREMALLAGWCEGATDYHFLPNYGYVEFLPVEGPTGPGEAVMHELVGTGYLNRCMPLIRYRTNDYAVPAEPGGCPACGRWHARAQTIHGRGQELLVASDGTAVPTTAIASFAYSHAQRFQFRQHTPGEVTYVFVPARPERVADTVSILDQEFKKLAGLKLTVRVEAVDELPATPGGKGRLVVRSVPLPWEQAAIGASVS